MLQILAEGLAGKVGPNPSGRFVLDLEQIELTPQLQEDLPEFAAVLEAALDSADPAAACSSGSPTTAADEQQGGAPSTTSTAIGSPGQQPRKAAAGLEQEAAALAAAGEQEPSAERELADRLAAASLRAVASSGSSRAVAGGGPGQRCFQLMESHGDQVRHLVVCVGCWHGGHSLVLLPVRTVRLTGALWPAPVPHGAGLRPALLVHCPITCCLWTLMLLCIPHLPPPRSSSCRLAPCT